MDNKIVALIVSIFLPPVAVYLKKGAGSDLIINIVLCLLMWVPGVLHAIWLTVL
ncbi:MAG: YqaE/Pmp3 family membrane protein [Halioglobus sp.]